MGSTDSSLPHTKEWVDALLRLKADPELRRDDGGKGPAHGGREILPPGDRPRLHRILLEAAGRA